MAKKNNMQTPIQWQWSETAFKSMVESTAFINIWEGAVRSSKTVASIVRWLDFVKNSEHSTFLITGKTESTVYRNIVGGHMGILNIMGEGAQFKKSGDGGSQLVLTWGKVQKVCYVVGANDEKAETKIRGMTVAGWYADEITLHPESFVKQALNRMSLDGAKAFWTTNPDSPYHYIKTEFIDKADKKGYKVFHFTLMDNPALPKTYIENISAAYTGLWYKRMILGLWVMADGVIYDNFNHDPIHMGGNVAADLPQGVDIREWWVTIDYGNSNATVFLLLGHGSDGQAYLMDEYVHSGRDEETQKSPSDYAEDLYRWIKDKEAFYGVPVIPKAIYIDPSAKGFILELYKKLPTALRNKIRTANNEVLLGIEITTSVIGINKLTVLARCKHALKELASYCWDPTAQKRGEDKPLKQNDHAMDALRYFFVATRKIWLKGERFK